MSRKALVPGSLFLFLALGGGSAGVAQTGGLEITPGGSVGLGTAAPQATRRSA